MNHETEQDLIIDKEITDDGFSEKKMALQLEKVIVQVSKTKQKTSKKTKQNPPAGGVVYEEK